MHMKLVFRADADMIAHTRPVLRFVQFELGLTMPPQPIDGQQRCSKSDRT